MITPTLVEPTENHEAGVASGVWSVQDQLEARRGGVWPEAGVANPDTLIESNFATTLYEGNGSTQSITTGIDSVNKDSLVWIKNRDAADNHVLTDTVRGATKILASNEADAEATDADTITAFSSTGFALGDDVKVNTNNESYVAWTFKKALKFFDVVTYTGNGTAGRTISHNLGSVPGFIIVKQYQAGETRPWSIYHRGIDSSAPEDYRIIFTTGARADDAGQWNDTAPTSSVFTVGDSTYVNNNGESYVAYLFAHETGDDSMIQCGNYTGNESTPPSVNLGWEPQWVLIKRTTAAGSWVIFDAMRGVPTGGNDEMLLANNTAVLYNGADQLNFTSTGFSFTTAGLNNTNTSGNYIYVAIRRPNMATITDATEVFAVDSGENSSDPRFTSGFPVDFAFVTLTTGSSKYASARLIQTRELRLDVNNAEGGGSNYDFTFNNGWVAGSVGNDYISYMWKRAKGYFDVVAYTGTGSARTVAHGLGVVPEMMWVKQRPYSSDWRVYHSALGNVKVLVLNTDAASANLTSAWNSTTPSSTVFTLGSSNDVNENPLAHIAYLFATLAGVSKVGSVTHSGSSTDVDCGFSAGARFVLLKRTDATGDWYYWDSVRGIVAGNDPYSLINTTAADVTNTDLIDPLASGFQISGDFTDGDYIFYAIA